MKSDDKSEKKHRQQIADEGRGRNGGALAYGRERYHDVIHDHEQVRSG
jgi:hypothetical protein